MCDTRRRNKLNEQHLTRFERGLSFSDSSVKSQFIFILSWIYILKIANVIIWIFCWYIFVNATFKNLKSIHYSFLKKYIGHIFLCWTQPRNVQEASICTFFHKNSASIRPRRVFFRRGNQIRRRLGGLGQTLKKQQ